MDPRLAFEKLGRNQLPGEGLWLVKIVQAAVAAGALELRIEVFSGNRARLNFECPQGWRADHLLEALFLQENPKERAIFHLAAGLRSAAAQLRSLSWSCGGHSVSVEEQQFEIRGPAGLGLRFVYQATTEDLTLNHFEVIDPERFQPLKDLDTAVSLVEALIDNLDAYRDFVFSKGDWAALSVGMLAICWIPTGALLVGGVTWGVLKASMHGAKKSLKRDLEGLLKLLARVSELHA